MSQIIYDFFSERKATWLKARIKPSLTEEEQSQLQQEANDKFALSNWLPDAAKRAAQLTMVSHPSKFSHPSAKTSSVIAQSEQAIDGYLRTGNVSYELDVFGNAAAMDVYKFLSVTLDDGKSVLDHLDADSVVIKNLFNLPTASYESLKQGFISIKQLGDANKIDHLVKQVYFPVADNYHLLSLLTPSGLLTQVKTRIDGMRFSEETKQAKECRKKNEFHECGYDDIFDLTITAYGGTQPQNVSVLNSQNAGRSYLLASMPPVLVQRQIRLPSQSFFKNSLRVRRFQEEFQAFDKLIKTGINNIHVRDGIKNCLKYIIDHALQQAFKVRAYTPGWSNSEHYQSLPLAQRIWLDDVHVEQREHQDDWLEVVVADFGRWILDSYEYLFKDSYTKLGDDELRAVKDIVYQAVISDKEFFK